MRWACAALLLAALLGVASHGGREFRAIRSQGGNAAPASALPEGGERGRAGGPGPSIEEAGALGATGLSDGAASHRHSSLSLQDEAISLLEGYRDAPSCSLAHSGYLDLLGRCWSCIVKGDGWVDLCFVQESADGGSEVRVMRLSAAQWEEELS